MAYNYIDLVHQKECINYSLVKLDLILSLSQACFHSLSFIKNVQNWFKRFGSKSVITYMALLLLKKKRKKSTCLKSTCNDDSAYCS